MWSKHTAGVNVPFARKGVTNDMGPGLGGDESYGGFFVGPQINAENLVLFQAGIIGSAIDDSNDLGLWRHFSGGNIAVARTGDTSAVGPGLGADTIFSPFFTSARVLDGSGEVVFSGLAQNLGTGARDIGLWRNDGIKNVAFVLSGNTGNLGPGLGDSRSFADGTTQNDLEFDTNQQSDVIFLAKLDDGTGGIWRNSGADNQAVALAGQTSILGPGLGTQDTFADFDTSSVFSNVAIDENQLAFFEGVLSGSSRHGLWLNSGSGNQVIALGSDDGHLGPQLGPGISFASFNRIAINNNGTAFFTVNLSLNVPSNRLLGLWSYHGGEIQKIVSYGELLDVDPTSGVDERTVRWVQIPSDLGGHSDDIAVNSLNEVVFRAGFADGTSGIFVARIVPESCSGFLLIAMMLSLTVIDRALVKRRRAN